MKRFDNIQGENMVLPTAALFAERAVTQHHKNTPSEGNKFIEEQKLLSGASEDGLMSKGSVEVDNLPVGLKYVVAVDGSTAGKVRK